MRSCHRLFCHASVTSREGRVSKNNKLKDKDGNYIIVTSREGGVSRKGLREDQVLG